MGTLGSVAKSLTEKNGLLRPDWIKITFFIVFSIGILPTFRMYPCICTVTSLQTVQRHLNFHSLITVLSHGFYWSPLTFDASWHHACSPLFLFFLYPLYGFIIYFGSSWLVHILRANASAISKFMKPNRIKVGLALVGCLFSFFVIGYLFVRYEMNTAEGILNLTPSQQSRYKLFENLRNLVNLSPLRFVFGAFSVISDLSLAISVLTANLVSLLLIDDPVSGYWTSLGLSMWNLPLNWIIYSSILAILSWYPTSCTLDWIYKKLQTKRLALSLVFLLGWFGYCAAIPFGIPRLLGVLLSPLLILILIAIIPSYLVLFHKIANAIHTRVSWHLKFEKESSIARDR